MAAASRQGPLRNHPNRAGGPRFRSATPPKDLMRNNRVVRDEAPIPPRRGRRRPTIHAFVAISTASRGWSAFADHDAVGPVPTPNDPVISPRILSSSFDRVTQTFGDPPPVITLQGPASRWVDLRAPDPSLSRRPCPKAEMAVLPSPLRQATAVTVKVVRGPIQSRNRPQGVPWFRSIRSMNPAYGLPRGPS